jgi:hypothetical protein
MFMGLVTAFWVVSNHRIVTWPNLVKTAHRYYISPTEDRTESIAPTRFYLVLVRCSENAY